jgi:GTP cyclohydrolase I
VQERLTSEIANAIMEELHPDGCGVVIEASHTCMTIRGVGKPGAVMITSAMRGGFRRRPETRAEFLSIIRSGHE